MYEYDSPCLHICSRRIQDRICSQANCETCKGCTHPLALYAIRTGYESTSPYFPLNRRNWLCYQTCVKALLCTFLIRTFHFEDSPSTLDRWRYFGAPASVIMQRRLRSFWRAFTMLSTVGWAHCCRSARFFMTYTKDLNFLKISLNPELLIHSRG